MNVLDAPEDHSDGRGVARYLGLSMREVSEAGAAVRLDATAQLTASIVDTNGRLHAGALLAMCDSVGGFCGGLGALPDGWVVTTNMMIRSVHRPVVAPLALRSEVLRKGKSAVVTSIDVADAEGNFVAGGSLTSAVLVPSDGVPQWDRPAQLVLPVAKSAAPFDAWLGVVPHGNGVALELVDELRNPWGIMHGGVTSALVDHAARRAVDPTDIATLSSTDVVLHFLSPAKVGPVHALGTVLGARPDGHVVEVEVHDQGADGRLVAIAVVTVARD